MPTDQSYREIPLTQGKVALVDEADFSCASQWKWYAKLKKSTNSFYARRNQYQDGKHSIIELHRAITGLRPGDRRNVDHASRDTLDNRRGNLRVCTNGQNTQNSKRRSDNKSGHKGVYFHSQHKKWVAQIRVKGKAINLGMRDTPEEAAVLYREAAERHFGEFARFA
jgi:hypothetical protein